MKFSLKKRKHQDQFNLYEAGRGIHMAGGARPLVTGAKGWGAGLESPGAFVGLLGCWPRAEVLRGQQTSARTPFILASWGFCPIFPGPGLDNLMLLFRPLS